MRCVWAWSVTRGNTHSCPKPQPVQPDTCRDRPHCRRLQLHADDLLLPTFPKKDMMMENMTHLCLTTTHRDTESGRRNVCACLTPSVVCPCLRITCTELLHYYDLVSCHYRVSRTFYKQSRWPCCLPRCTTSCNECLPCMKRVS